jgi:hypothetical protein
MFLERAKSPYSHYLDILGSWPTGLALASQWFVYFNFDTLKRNGSLNSFEQILNYNEASNWQFNKEVTKFMVDGRIQHSFENLTGCVFAKQVDLPKENIDVKHTGLEYGGFQAPYTAAARSPYDHLKITMLETNASFLDLIIRPWLLLVGYHGLVARPKSSYKYIKADYADVVLLAKTGAYTKMTIRKLYRFYNVAPVTIDGESYSYTPDNLKFSPVSFAYEKYCISDMMTGKFLKLD